MEVIYKDGSTSTFTEGGSYHAGELALQRIRLLTAKSALKVNIESGMEMTRDGSWAAVMNVIAPITGKDYRSGKRLTVKGKREALADCIELLATLEYEAVIYNEEDYEPTCDICGVGQYHSEHLDWNGETGNHFLCEDQ